MPEKLFILILPLSSDFYERFIKRSFFLLTMNLVPESHLDLVCLYQEFYDKVQKSTSVLYPSCALDVSPSQVFSNVTYVDIEDGISGAMQEFRKQGFKAVCQDIRNYKPTEHHDLLILLNPAIPAEWASQHIEEGAFIIANNYHGTATEMFCDPVHYALFGTIDFTEKNRKEERYKAVVSQNLDDLFIPCKDEKEVQERRPDIYKFISSVYPSLLQSFGQPTEGKSFGEIYEEVQKFKGSSIELPHRRVAERYIFVKR